MFKFEVLRGHHRELEVTYGPGDIVTSKHELDVMFQNKFRRLAVVQEMAAPKVVEEDTNLLEDDTDETTATDVSDQFEVFDDYKVMQYEEGFVIEKDGENVLNKYLATKKHVEVALKKLAHAKK